MCCSFDGVAPQYNHNHMPVYLWPVSKYIYCVCKYRMSTTLPTLTMVPIVINVDISSMPIVRIPYGWDEHPYQRILMDLIRRFNVVREKHLKQLLDHATMTYVSQISLTDSTRKKLMTSKWNPIFQKGPSSDFSLGLRKNPSDTSKPTILLDNVP